MSNLVPILEDIRTKIYSLVEDFSKVGTELFNYSASNIFTIAEQNITILNILQNGDIVPTNQYTFDTTTNEITLNSTLTSGDIIQVNYNYRQYTDDEMTGYIRASMVWISVYGHNNKDFMLDEDLDSINPTPTAQETDLIALIASIILKPDYTSYRLPNLTVTYRREIPKYERIEKLIAKWEQCSAGVIDTVQFNIYVY
jgi:hypothetical protein